jgi:hypothetical protein
MGLSKSFMTGTANGKEGAFSPPFFITTSSRLAKTIFPNIQILLQMLNGAVAL